MGRHCRARRCVLRGCLLKCLPQAGSSLRGAPARRRGPAQLPRRPDKRESVRDARRAAPGPRAGLGRDVRYVGAGARGSTPARPRHIGTTASTACCCATYSSWCCKSRRTVAWKIYWGFSAFFSCGGAALRKRERFITEQATNPTNWWDPLSARGTGATGSLAGPLRGLTLIGYTDCSQCDLLSLSHTRAGHAFRRRTPVPHNLWSTPNALRHY